MPSLRKVISSLLFDAHANADHRQHIDLSHGLRIGIRLAEREVTFYIGRRNRQPSQVEWQTVLSYLPPGYLPTTDTKPLPSIQSHRDWVYLVAVWTPRKEIIFI